jgi:uncharacterized membrane protein YkoI
MMKKSSYFVKGLVVLSLIGTMAMADTSRESNDNNQKELQVKSSIQVKDSASEIAQKNAAKINTEEALNIAKTKFGGDAIGTQLENINGNLVYQIDVLKNNQVTNILIDAGNGKILATKIEKSDAEANENGENNGENENENDGPWYRFWG